MLILLKVFFLVIFIYTKPIFASEECTSEKNLKIGLINNDYIDYQYYLYYELGNYVQQNNIDFEFINPLSYEKFVEELSKTERLIFFPQWLESFNRVTIEAKILNCKITTNKW